MTSTQIEQHRRPHETGDAVLHAAEQFLSAGLCPLPAHRVGASKKVTVKWKTYQDSPPTEAEWADWAERDANAICLLAGAVSGNLECIDFDMEGEKFDAWASAVEAAAPGLVDRLVLQRTPSGGRHAIYRCEPVVDRSRKLAERRILCEDDAEVVLGGKTYKPRRDKADGRWYVTVATIETRGEGGVFLCAPSAGYEVVQGDVTRPPTLTEGERDALIAVACDLSEWRPPMVEGARPRKSGGTGSRPGDDYAARGDVRECLRSHGWTQVTEGGNERWRRPGKHDGCSATLKDGCFYVFSSSAAPFEPGRGYGAFAVYALLEHGGDYSAAARELATKGFGQRESRREVRERAEAEPGVPRNEPVRIEIGTDEYRVIDESIAALARDPDVYARGNMLVRVAAASRDGRPSICRLPIPTLRERLSRACRYTRFVRDEETDAHPPGWAVDAVAARGRWEGIRDLRSLALAPYLAPDGEVVQSPGYDPATGVLLIPSGEFPSVPAEPGRDDATHAAAALLDVVGDFAFEAPEHRAAWVASVLTPLARQAFQGPAPLFLIDANVRGAGKGLLARVSAEIATGEDIGAEAYVHDAEEMRKRITSIAVAGHPIILLDNVAGAFGNASLDRALTTTRWQDRILGTSEQVDVPLLATWLATGNNIQVAADTARRVVHIRLDVLHERPEERDGFAHPNLIAWVARERGRLLCAALTILRAYVVAGRPDMQLAPMGSFEGWSGLVRQAVVWSGLPDPCESRHRLEAMADTEKDQLEGLLCGFEVWDPHGHGVVLADLVATLYPRDAERPHDDRSRTVRAAIEEVAGSPAGTVPSVRKLGNRLKHLRRRVSAGRYLDFNPAEKDRGGQVWRLHRAGGRAE